jgi:hypothetical protein
MGTYRSNWQLPLELANYTVGMSHPATGSLRVFRAAMLDEHALSTTSSAAPRTSPTLLNPRTVPPQGRRIARDGEPASSQ